MAFSLGKKSQASLVGVHPVLIAIVQRAIGISAQDFSVNEGVRTLARQKELKAAGASKTLNSAHIPVVDRSGLSTQTLGHAVDLTAYVAGGPRWEWGLYYPIAAAMAQAAKELNVAKNLCWGGVWDRWMSEYTGDADVMRKAVIAYQQRHAGPDFLDGPHFQIYRKG